MTQDMKDFLMYAEKSTNVVAQNVQSELVKRIHTKVEKVKCDKEMEVEYMTLLQRDREKIEEGRLEGIELAKKVFKLKQQGKTNQEIAAECSILEEEVEEILN